ncbi:unnamed protein product [Adineta steineri]|uniref:Carbohydrate sulfotransferase n=1 Tax=Adineta steineri TaxID=433720 RepID=A0A818UJV4_9BILA|nr:unnamed protein product [Adineta steineri]CAF3701646.1 unnamed protein product [Adineta steineri]
MKHSGIGNLFSHRLQYRMIYVVNFAFLCVIIVYLSFYLMLWRVTKVVEKPDQFCREYKPSIVHKNLLYIQSMNILYCNVPKAASSNLRRVLHAHLFPNSRQNPDRSQVWRNFEKDFRKFYLDNNVESQSIINNRTTNIFKFLLVRHPFRRIYSAYNDKFVHEHLDNALFGWQATEEGILLQMYPNETVLSLRRRDARLDFRTFLLFLVDSVKRKRSMDNHWDQIVSRCSVCHIDYDWVGKVENLKEDGPILLKQFKGMTKYGIEFPSWKLDEPEHNKTDLNDKQIVELFRMTLNSQDDFRMLVDYYKPDFQAFKYALPHY